MVAKYSSVHLLNVPSLSTKKVAVRGALIPHPLRSYKINNANLSSIDDNDDSVTPKNTPKSRALSFTVNEASPSSLKLSPSSTSLNSPSDNYSSNERSNGFNTPTSQSSPSTTATMQTPSPLLFNDLPVIVFIHGLGGQISQFESLINFFSQFVDIAGIDLPGCGGSRPQSQQPGKTSYMDTGDDDKLFSVNQKLTFDDYSSDNMVEILLEFFNSIEYDDNEKVTLKNRDLILIGHSMGTSLAAKLTAKLGSRVKGLIILTPPSSTSAEQRKQLKFISSLPYFVFDTFRSVDRLDALESPSVTRMLSSEATDTIKRKQLRTNLDVDTQSWIKIAYGFTPATKEEWVESSKNDKPIFLIAATEDKVTPPSCITQIEKWIKEGNPEHNNVTTFIIPNASHMVMAERPQITCGLIGEFVASKIDEKISLTWLLRFKANVGGGKWCLKNEAKWKKLKSVSERIVNPFNGKLSPFRAMKTLRQNDDEHNPTDLENKYTDITDIIDISSYEPPYVISGFKRIIPHKFATVSKIPPPLPTVKEFISLVDEIIEKEHSKGIADPVIAVHCHYGFNRTGFLVCSYLIEKCGFSIEDAVNAFKIAREPGIKHSHFIDELYIRYQL